MAASILDGKSIARGIRKNLKGLVAALGEGGFRPCLAVVLAGDDPASLIYVRTKVRMCKRVGIESRVERLPATASETDVIGRVQGLNDDPSVHGILVQLPLPAGMDARRVVRSIDPAKDVDGLHPISLGRLVAGQEGFVPCTPLGVMRLLDEADIALQGQIAVVVGRSLLVGKPIAQLLLRRDCTVVQCHSRTEDLAEEVRRADILVAAVGRPGLIRGAWIKEGATVIDVGTNRVDDKLVGDVDFEGACARASAITPVPGGVGPMTVAMLLVNTYTAAQRAVAGAPAA